MKICTLSALSLPMLALAARIDVSVGGLGDLVLKYTPEFVNAAIGDEVFFTFKQKNHTVTQSTFQNPCQPSDGGFDSGFFPVPAEQTDGFQQARFTVTTADPTWVFCAQGNHCRMGMVFSINPGDKFTDFKNAAINGVAPAPPPSIPIPSSVAPVPSSTPAPLAPPPSSSASALVSVTKTYSSYPGSAAPTATTPKEHIVIVGGPGKLLYTPSAVTAQVGDSVVFQFQQKNHTATQSSFGDPCKSLTLTSSNGQSGFDSGFMPVEDGSTTFPNYTIPITDTAPIWVFCKAGTHCSQGMVMSINAVESSAQSSAAFLAKAKASTPTTGSAAPATPSNGAESVKGALGVVLSLVAGTVLFV